jgi:hypothetical protein
MGNIIDLERERKLRENFSDQKAVTPDDEFLGIKEDEYHLARNVRKLVAASGKVQDPTRLILANNLGRLLDRFGRELSRDKLVRIALKTDNIKPSERLGRYQIRPNSKNNKTKQKRLSKDPAQYLALAEVAAELTGNNPDQFIVELFSGTKFDPSQNDEIIDTKPAERLTEVIDARCNLMAEKYLLNETMKMRRRHKAWPTNKDSDGIYDYEVDHESPAMQRLVGSISLFSILRSEGICEWHGGDLNWIARPVRFVERVKFQVFCNNDGIISNNFRVTPNLHLPPSKKENKREYYPEEWALLPFDGSKPWLVGPEFAGYWVGIDENGSLDVDRYRGLHETLDGEDAKMESLGVMRLQLDHGLDFSRTNEVWKSRLSEKLTGSSAKANLAIYSPINDRLSIGSVSRWLDIPISKIVRLLGDSFRFHTQFGQPDERTFKFDSSRGLSPPDSMIAEVESSLYYDGYQGTFDDSPRNRDLTEIVPPTYEVGPSGEYIDVPEEEIDVSHTQTFLDELENDIAAQVLGFWRWLEKIRKDGYRRSSEVLLKIDRERQELRVKRNNN